MCKIVHWLKCHITQTFHKFSFIWVIKIIHPTPNECFRPWEPFMHRGSCLKDFWTHFHHNKLLWEVSHSSRFFSAALHSWSTQKLWPSTQPRSIRTGKAPTCACFSSTSVLRLTASFPPYLNQEAPSQVHQFLLCGFDHPTGSSTGPQGCVHAARQLEVYTQIQRRREIC